MSRPTWTYINANILNHRQVENWRWMGGDCRLGVGACLCIVGGDRCWKDYLSVLHDAQLMLNKQQQIWCGIFSRAVPIR